MLPLTRFGLHPAALAAGVLMLALSATDASAALLSVVPNTSPPGSVNLTTAGTIDWTIYTFNDSGTVDLSGAPSNRRSGGSGISNIATSGGSPTGGVTLRSVTTLQDISYTNGTSPASGSGTDVRGIASNPLDTNNVGLTFTVTGDTATPRQLQVYLSGLNATGRFVATLNGATTYSNDIVYTGTKSNTLYTVNFQPDAPTDVLTITYTAVNQSASTTDNSHVLISAIALSPVPEPTAAALLGLAAAGAILRRRRSC